jgi:muconate cycloisomerase
VHTDQGIIGVGETQAWRRQGGGEVLGNLVRMVKDHFEPLVIGQSPFNVNGILRQLDDAFAHTLYAQAALSDALHDAMGKAVGLPVHQLLGGECRDRARVGVILSMKPTVEELVDSAQKFFDQGYRYFGLKIGIDPKRDLANVEAMRHRFGSDITMRVDANAALTYDAALGLLKKLEPFDIDAAEQPLASWDLNGLAALARGTSIPLMVDESISTSHSLVEIIDKRAATAIHTKLAKNGGILQTWKLWQMAESVGMRICPGNHPCTGVGVAAALHMCAAWQGALIDGAFAVGLSGTLQTDVIAQPMNIDNGELRVPQGPGLGVELDFDKINHFRVDR